MTVAYLPTVPSDRKAALCGLMNLSSGIGLEFGPLTAPLVRPEEGDIRYVDAMSTEEIKRQFKDDPSHPTELMMPVHYVWQGGSLADVVGETRFDYALASHVIEHVPDPIGWLNGILDVLKDGGLIGLAIPDKRYTFDIRRPTTTTATLIDHWLRQASRPSPMQVYDHVSTVTKVGVEEVNALHAGVVTPNCFNRHHDDAMALDYARRAHETTEYINVHASVWTPAAFLTSLRDLIGLGILPVEVADFYDTTPGLQEFVCVLRGAPDTSPAAVKARQEHIDGLASAVRGSAYDMSAIV
jgi:SAM-dependent methyltransferase